MENVLRVEVVGEVPQTLSERFEGYYSNASLITFIETTSYHLSSHK